MSHFVALCLKVAQVVWIGRRLDGDLLNDGETIGLETDALFGIVGQEAHLAQAEIVQHLSANAVVARVGGMAQRVVGFDRVEPFALLQLVRFELV